MAEPLLQIKNLTKSFGGVKALDDVQFSLRAGEVHALMGENGAGKSTLMRILLGLESADAGEIIFDGIKQEILSKKTTLRPGIVMIHQELLVVPELSIAANIFLGRETTSWIPGWLDEGAIYQKAQELLADLGLSLDARNKMKYLSVAERQMVEIAKAISQDARIIIMDEPTSALSDKEVTTLFGVIEDLKARDVAIVYISHKMEEINRIADTITVLRDGCYMATHPAAALSRDALISLMVGRELDTLFPAAMAQFGEPILAVEGLGSAEKFADISFEIKAGEVLGLAGLMGAGRTEISRAIFGLEPPTQGEIFIKGEKVIIRSPSDAIRHGMGYLSEDRQGWGCIPGMSVQHTLTLSSLRKYAKSGFVNQESEQKAAAEMVANLGVKTAGLHQKVTQLSGGNQQKVLLGKVLLARPQLLILDEPTRGIDIGAKHEIFKLIRQLTAQGMAILLISSELSEILGLCDRILVISEGKQTALLSGKEATQEKIMHYATPQR